MHQIWLGLYWILRCEMNIFWAYGICLRSYNEFYPLGLRDKLGCGPYSKYHMPRKCSFHNVKSNRGQAKFGAKQVCATRAARRVAVARHLVLRRGSAVGFGRLARSNARFGSVARSNARLKRKSAKDRGSSRACAAGRGPRARLRCAAAGLGRASRGRGAAAASENWARRAACGATRAPPTGPPRAGGGVRLSRAAQNEYSNLRGVGARRAPPPYPPLWQGGDRVAAVRTVAAFGQLASLMGRRGSVCVGGSIHGPHPPQNRVLILGPTAAVK